jgi:hypothetical protein
VANSGNLDKVTNAAVEFGFEPVSLSGLTKKHQSRTLERELIMTSVTVKYTYQDLRATPDDRNRHEIFEGGLIVTPAPNEAHQRGGTKLNIKRAFWT